MAVAVAINDRDVAGSRYKRQVTATFSGTYTTGGEAPTVGWLKALEFSTKVTSCAQNGGQGVAVGVVGSYDRATNKLLLFRADQIDDFLEELPNAQSLTNVVLELTFEGI